MNQLRQLSDEEKQIYLKSLKLFDDGKRRLQVKLKELDHMISEGLRVNFEEKLDELKRKKRELCSEIQELDVKILTAQDHLERGVEVKEDKPEEKNG